MTVQVANASIKWRKGRYSVTSKTKRETSQAQQERKQQLLLQNDHLLAMVFSFLGSSHDIVLDENGRDQTSHKELLWVKDAGIVYSKLTRVCRTWRKVCNERASFILGRLNVNLDALHISKVVPCIHWLCAHKISIGSLIFQAELGDVLFLEQLLNTCDTSKLTFVRAICDLVRGNYPIEAHYRSQWVTEAYLHERGSSEGVVIDLTGGSGGSLDSLENMTRAIGLPYCFPAPTQRQLHDTIAANCQDLLHLEINITMPNAPVNCREYLSASLFSLHLVHKLEVTVGVVGYENNGELNGHFDGMIVTRIVENLDQLRELSVKSNGSCMYGRRIHIASQTLNTLDVSRLSKQSYISGVLPNLTTLLYHANVYGSGIVPEFNAGQLQHVRYVNRHNDEYERECRFYASQATIHRLDVPPTCEIVGLSETPDNISAWGALQLFLHAHFETFD